MESYGYRLVDAAEKAMTPAEMRAKIARLAADLAATEALKQLHAEMRMQAEAEVARLSEELGCTKTERHGDAEYIGHLTTRLTAMTTDRDKWSAESADNLRKLVAMTANAEALDKALRSGNAWLQMKALAAHAKLMEGK